MRGSPGTRPGRGPGSRAVRYVGTGDGWCAARLVFDTIESTALQTHMHFANTHASSTSACTTCTGVGCSVPAHHDPRGGLCHCVSNAHVAKRACLVGPARTGVRSDHTACGRESGVGMLRHPRLLGVTPSRNPDLPASPRASFAPVAKTSKPHTPAMLSTARSNLSTCSAAHTASAGGMACEEACSPPAALGPKRKEA